ncbi:MAG: hypothetical protein HYY17_07955 [Planctomycetes bacterium]|nr:hypothetical protein [Planctomycetota bacterium]
MGLGGVELVMEIEECFRVGISDAEAQKISTPGEICEFLAGTWIGYQPVGCLSMSVFHRVRRALELPARAGPDAALPCAAPPRFPGLRGPRQKVRTVGELVLELVARNYGRLSETESVWNPKEVWRSVQLIVADMVRVAPGRVRRDALLVDDLGLE